MKSKSRDRCAGTPHGPKRATSVLYDPNMALEWEQVTIDALRPVELGRWWAEALGWVIVDDGPEVVEIRATPEQLPGLLFVPSSEPKQTKNRMHLDVRPGDQTAEVERLLALGASKVDIGQQGVPWVVLADPEGNEFCVLRQDSHSQPRAAGQGGF